MTKKLMVLLLLSGFTLLVACSNNKAPLSPTDSNQALSSSARLPEKLSQIVITDVNGNPVSGASILIGTAEGTPFKNNLLKTDQNGSFVPPSEWTTAQPLTITADGFVRTTFMEELPTQKNFEVRFRNAQTKPELGGITTGFGDLKKDGFVDVGIIIPAFTRTGLLSFQASSLLSPETDSIDVIGQTLTLPSNITLPEQTEEIFPVVVKLNKPNYRMFFDRPAAYKVVSAHVKFPLKKVIGKKGLDLVNQFTFVEAGLTSTQIRADKQILDLPVNQFQFDSSVSVQAPALSQTQNVLVVPLAADETSLYPTDIKTLASNETKQLTFKPNSDGFVLAVLRDSTSALDSTSDDFMSVELHANGNLTPLNFLPLVSAPKYANGVLTIEPPTNLSGLSSVATLATLSSIEVKNLGKSKYEIKNPEWDVYVPGWTNQISLPAALITIKADQLRWETTFLAAPKSDSPLSLGPSMMNSVTHLTRSAVNL